jgi:hypothetical protein
MGKIIKSTQMTVNWLLKCYASFTSMNLTFDHYWTCNDRQFMAFTKISVKMGKIIKSTQMTVNWLLKYYASFTSINLTFDHYWTYNDRQFMAFTKSK